MYLKFHCSLKLQVFLVQNLLNVLLPNSVQPEITLLKEPNPAERLQMALPYELKIH